MFINNLNPVFINIGFVEIRWYSLAYIFGILFAVIFSKILIQKFSLNYKQDIFDDFLPYSIIGIIFGGRLGYVIFYDFIFFVNNPIEIIKIWNGGMSFHGGLIGVILASSLFCKKNNLNYLNFTDLLAVLTPFGLFLGRISNFINSELIGKPTDGPWSVIFIKVDNLARHPSQIYEAFLEGLLLFCLTYLIFKNKFSIKGFTSGCFLTLYGIFRIFSEQFRQPDLHLGLILFNFSLGSILSFVMIFFGIYLILNNNEHSKKI